MNEKKDHWNNLLEVAAPEIVKFLKLGNPRPVDIQRVKVAQSTLSNITRHEATESAKEQTRAVVGRMISRTPDETAEYLRLSAPSLQVPAAKE